MLHDVFTCEQWRIAPDANVKLPRIVHRLALHFVGELLVSAVDEVRTLQSTHLLISIDAWRVRHVLEEVIDL